MRLSAYILIGLSLLSLDRHVLAGEAYLINMMSPDDEANLTPTQLDYRIKGLERAFPQSTLSYERILTLERLKDYARVMSNAPQGISGLVLFTHGGSGRRTQEQIEVIQKRGFTGTNSYLWTGLQIGGDQDDNTVTISLNNPLPEGPVRQIFGQLAGKWAPGARLIIDACNGLSVGNLAEKKEIVGQVAKNFSLTNGTVFMSTVESSAHWVSAIYQTPFWEANNIWEGAGKFVSQALPYIGVPMAYIHDGHYNQGLLADIENGNVVKIRPYDLYRIEQNPMINP